MQPGCWHACSVSWKMMLSSLAAPGIWYMTTVSSWDLSWWLLDVWDYSLRAFVVCSGSGIRMRKCASMSIAWTARSASSSLCTTLLLRLHFVIVVVLVVLRFLFRWHWSCFIGPSHCLHRFHIHYVTFPSQNPCSCLHQYALCHCRSHWRHCCRPQNRYRDFRLRVSIGGQWLVIARCVLCFGAFLDLRRSGSFVVMFYNPYHDIHYHMWAFRLHSSLYGIPCFYCWRLHHLPFLPFNALHYRRYRALFKSRRHHRHASMRHGVCRHYLFFIILFLLFYPCLVWHHERRHLCYVERQTYNVQVFVGLGYQNGGKRPCYRICLLRLRVCWDVMERSGLRDADVTHTGATEPLLCRIVCRTRFDVWLDPVLKSLVFQKPLNRIGVLRQCGNQVS